jgi:DNA-binding PadR family transcriptional regulator
MTKAEVLSIFDRAGGFLTPDQVRAQFHPSPDRRSVYSYVLRLSRQGLLKPKQAGRGRLAYHLTDRGRQRLEYLREKSNKDLSA